MQVILKPVSHPDLGEIIINDPLFSIGRHQPPFSSYPPETVERLSRRHARIFEQDGAFHIVDLGSLNGTTVNGKPLPQHHLQLQQDDKICFADRLTYKSIVHDKPTTATTGEKETAQVILTLAPQKPDSGLEPIVVSEFPFLISKSNEVFSRYSKTCQDELNYISRRHAHIFTRQGDLYIEDLGSTNGTFVSESRLDENARLLQDGDSIAFGGNFFIYSVKVDHIEPLPEQFTKDETVLIQGLPNGTDVTRTTFVTSADSFLDIFCMDEDEEQQASSDDEDPAGRNKDNLGGEKSKRGGRLARFSAFFRELRGAFSEKETRGRTGGGWAVTTTALVALAAWIGFFYLQDTPEREIDRLLTEGEYERSTRLAEKFLSENPNDKEVSGLAAKSLVRYLVPDWTERLSNSEFNKAHDTLEQARQMSQHNSSGLALLELLGWITDLEELVHDRGGDNAPISIFEHEERIESLLQWWDDDIEGHRRMAGQIARYEPAFGDTRAKVFSHLRTLHSEKSTYLAVLERFKQTVEARLESDSVEEMSREISDFHARYPRIAGINKLEQDLQNYLLVRAEIKADRLLNAVHKVNELEFLTPVFVKKIASIRTGQLPPDDIIEQYQQSSNMWRDGQPDEAITALESLKEGAWGKVATSELERKQAVLEQYRALEQRRKKEGYAQELVAFFSSLNSEEDVYFLQAIQTEFQTHQDKVLQDAERSLNDAHAAWNKYRKNGGIRGLQRLEEKISKKFRNQAKYLTDAYKRAHQGAEIYKMLKLDDKSSVQVFYQAILKEYRLQRRSLQELGMVLEPTVLEAKIELLPDPDRSTSGPDSGSFHNLVRDETL